jgi:hypothetical protein
LKSPAAKKRALRVAEELEMLAGAAEIGATHFEDLE